MLDPDPASIFIAFLFAALVILFQICDEAFSAIGEARIRELEEDGNRRARTIRQLTENQQRFSFRIRIASVFGAIGLAYCVEYVFADALYQSLHQPLAPAIGTVCTLLLSYLLLAVGTAFLFGFVCCLLPRRLISRNPEKYALALAPVFTVFYALSFPLYGLCALLTYPFVRIAGVELHEEDESVTEEDIREMMDVGEEIGAIEAFRKIW